MTFEEAIQDIESHEFAAKLGLASDFKTFTRIAASQISVKELFKQLEKPEIEDRLYNRAVDLSQRSIDPRYENSLDKALTIYLWVTDLRNPHLALLMAEHIIHAPQCWWAHMLSKHLRRIRPLREMSEAANQIKSIGPVSPYEVETIDETYGAILTFDLYPAKKFANTPSSIVGTAAKVKTWEQPLLPDEPAQSLKIRGLSHSDYKVEVDL